MSKDIDGMLEQSRENLENTGVSIEVYSAIREELLHFNATDELITIAKLLNNGDKEEAQFQVRYIKETTSNIIEHNYSKHASDAGLQSFIDREFNELFQAIEKYDTSDILSTENDYSIGDFSVMGFGEIFRAKLQVYLLTQEGVNAVYVDPYIVGGTLKNLGEALDFYKQEIIELIENSKNQELAIAVPGFIPNLQGGINSMIGRGFTDTITGLVSLALLETNKFDAVIFELQKDVPGLMSTNPNELEDGFNRAELLDEVSIKLAKKLFGEDGANSQLLNGKTLNEYIISALEKYDNFSIELLNPKAKDGRKTIIKKEVDSTPGKVQIIASRDDVPNKYRYGLGGARVNSLYLLGENLGTLENNFLIRVSDTLSEISGVTYHIQDGSLLVINFSGDYNPMNDSALKIDDRKARYNQIIRDKGIIVTEKEKQKIALDILHREFVEQRDDSKEKIAEVA